MRIALLTLGVVCCSVLLPALAHAAVLRGVEVSRSSEYIDVALSFDGLPQYTESERHEPYRYVLSFPGTKIEVPKAQRDALSKLPGKLLTRVTVAQGGEDSSVGFYLNAAVPPQISQNGKGWVVRFLNGARVEQTQTLSPGVELVERVVGHDYNGNLALYLARLAPGCRAELYSAAADRYDGKTRLRTPSNFARLESADIVINGGFFGGRGQHLSTLVEEGIMRATGVYPSRPMLVVTDRGELLVGRYNVVTALHFDGSTLNITAKNFPFEPGKTIVYDHTYPLDTLPQAAMYYYVVDRGTMRFHGTTTAGLTLQPGQLLLANDIMPEANPLRRIPDGASVELETRITDAAGNVVRARSAIGGAPMLVEGGQVSISSALDSVRDDIATSRRSRTAVGITRDGKLLLAVVKELPGAGYGGVTLKALAELLIAEGAVTALNLDGGGSSAMVVGGRSLNIAEERQRPVSNVLSIRLH